MMIYVEEAKLDAKNLSKALIMPRRTLLAGAVGAALMTVFGGVARAATSLSKENNLMTARFNTPIYGNDALSIPYRKALPLTAPRARYTGFKPEKIILPKGSVRRSGAKPLPVDIVFERDVALKMRDGTTIYTDVFRPAKEGKYPALVAWSPYGKEIGGQWLDDVHGRAGVPLEWVSELQKFEGPDPAFWVEQGYVVLNPDPRGAYNSEGNITYWGRQLAEDGYDFIEWAAEQPWSSGKIGMAGNSWLAVSQWFIAAEKPPHLAAIAPWEGFSDHFRDTGNRGGIPAPAFPEAIIQTFAGKGYIEDQPRMIVEQQVMNSYWEDKKARLENIEIPAYVVASYTNAAHTHGSFDGYRNIPSKDKWLRVNNTNEWLDFYTPKYEAELLAFFDHFLKGNKNGFENTPKVRICVLDPSGTDVVDRVESEWPPARAVAKKLYLKDSTQLAERPPEAIAQLSYDTASKEKLSLSYAFAEDTEITGYMSLRLWVEAKGSNDMELAITVEKRDAKGNPYNRELGEGMVGPVAATGLLRVSHRELDPKLSTPSEPYLTHRSEQFLSPGEIVPVDISIWPMAMRYKAGEELYLTISAHHPMSTDFDMGFGAAPIELAESEITYMPGKAAALKKFGGTAATSPSYIHDLRVPTPVSRNHGKHVIHVGGDHDSHLLIPLIPA
jgi:predicted acyl esterase